MGQQLAAAHQRVAAKPVRLCPRVGEAVRLSGLAWGACVRRVGVRGGALAAPRPKGRERFLQSLLSAKGARRRPRERSSAGASGGLLPAGSGKADAVWNSTRQTATTSHNFILESRPAAAPAPASERTREHTLEHKPWARHPRGSWSPLRARHRPAPRPVQPSGSLGIAVLPSKSPVHCPPQCAPGGALSASSYNGPSRSPPDPRGRIFFFFLIKAVVPVGPTRTPGLPTSPQSSLAKPTPSPWGRPGSPHAVSSTPAGDLPSSPGSSQRLPSDPLFILE